MDEEIAMAETEQGDTGDTVSNEVEASADVSNSPVKRGRGRPQGSKKMKVCVTDVNMTELLAANSNGEPAQLRRGRGRPRLSETKHTGQPPKPANSSVESHKGRGRPKGSKNRSSIQNSSTERSPKRRGRPKKLAKKAAAEDLLNGGSNAPKRGRPKGSKNKSGASGEEEGSSVMPRKRGRPKGSLNKKPRLGSSEGERGLLPQRRRGRPRKGMEKSASMATGVSQPVKRGRGRPKGSLNKKPSAFRVRGKVGRPPKVSGLTGRGRKRGRPRQQPGKRGRPRKYPLPSPEELKKPKVWKPLGRPRKYPRVDPPEGAVPAPRRGRGRPRKSESKKGAHLRKYFPASPSTPQNLSDEPPRKRGRPPSAARNEDDVPRKRGRPKGSVNKNKARGEPQLDSTLPNHSKEGSNPADAGERNEAELAAKETETLAVTRGEESEETVIVQDVSFDISDQA